MSPTNDQRSNNGADHHASTDDTSSRSRRSVLKTLGIGGTVLTLPATLSETDGSASAAASSSGPIWTSPVESHAYFEGDNGFFDDSFDEGGLSIRKQLILRDKSPGPQDTTEYYLTMASLGAAYNTVTTSDEVIQQKVFHSNHRMEVQCDHPEVPADDARLSGGINEERAQIGRNIENLVFDDFFASTPRHYSKPASEIDLSNFDGPSHLLSATALLLSAGALSAPALGFTAGLATVMSGTAFSFSTLGFLNSLSGPDNASNFYSSEDRVGRKLKESSGNIISQRKNLYNYVHLQDYLIRIPNDEVVTVTFKDSIESNQDGYGGPGFGSEKMIKRTYKAKDAVNSVKDTEWKVEFAPEFLGATVQNREWISDPLDGTDDSGGDGDGDGGGADPCRGTNICIT
jgi:hypothetical protein